MTLEEIEKEAMVIMKYRRSLDLDDTFVPLDVKQYDWLIAEVKRLRNDINIMVQKAADNYLEGYRELGNRAANAENERDDVLCEVKRLREENADLNHTFDMIHKADVRGVQLYREAHPDYPEVGMPDQGELICWLIGEVERMKSLLRTADSMVVANRVGYFVYDQK